MALGKLSIKQRVEAINKMIKELEDERTKIQEECPHENTTNVNYMYRVGATAPAEVCQDCGKVVQFL